METKDVVTNPFAVSFAGALLGLKAWPGGTWTEKACNLTLGFLIAIVGGPALAEYLHVESVRISAAIIFACGAAGLVVFASLIEGLRQTKVSALIARWFPSAKPSEKE